MTKDTIYVCSVCHEVNSVKRLHCKSCGTIPAQYSIAGIAVTEHSDCYLEIKVAFGCERQKGRRTIKRTPRTVPLDYYAES